MIDFGLSKVWEPNTKMEASCGTLGYIAPEVLNKTYSSKCDLRLVFSSSEPLKSLISVESRPQGS